MRGTKIWLLGGLTALVLSGCGLLPGTERTETEEVHVGDTVSTSWFDYTITSAQSADSYQARAADEGLNPDGSMVYERFPSRDHTDQELHWWVQAENVVGHANLYQHFADEAALDVAARCWSFIRTRLIDREHGEWHWSLLPDGTVNRRDDKAGFWKCPYHNGRMCMELIERFNG